MYLNAPYIIRREPVMQFREEFEATSIGIFRDLIAILKRSP